MPDLTDDVARAKADAKRWRSRSRLQLFVAIGATPLIILGDDWWLRLIYAVVMMSNAFLLGQSRMLLLAARQEAWAAETSHVIANMINSGMYSKEEIQQAVQEGEMPPVFDRNWLQRAVAWLAARRRAGGGLERPCTRPNCPLPQPHGHYS